MPTYQYSCTECGHFFEAFQSFSDDSLTECPECGGRLRKVYNAVGVVFKGSGFYRTDSRETPAGSKSDNSSDASTNGAGEAAKGDSGATKSSDASSSSGSKESTASKGGSDSKSSSTKASATS